MKEILFRHKFDTILALSMPILLLVMTATHSIVFLYVILGLCVLNIQKPVAIFPVYFLASLSTAYFSIGEGMSAGRFLSLVMVTSLLLNILEKGSNRTTNDHFLLWIVFSLYVFMSAMTSVTGSLVPFAMLIQGLLVLLLLPRLKNVDVEYFNSLLYMTCVIAIIGVWILFISNGFEQLLYERYSGTEGETKSNRIAMMVMQIGLVIISPFVANVQNKIIKWISVVGYLLSIIIIVFTGSRASLLASIGAFIILFSKMSKQNLKSFIIPAIVVTIVAVVMITQFSQLDSVVLDRFSLQALEDSEGSDRMPAIEIFLKHIFPEYPIFGVGLGGENFNAVAVNYGMDHPCHNIFFDPLAQLGVVGFSILLCLCFKILKKTWLCFILAKNKFPFVMSLLLVFGAVIDGVGETVYLEKWFWNALSLCLFFIANFNKYSKWGNTNL